jgi:hypothetical protein
MALRARYCIARVFVLPYYKKEAHMTPEKSITTVALHNVLIVQEIETFRAPLPKSEEMRQELRDFWYDFLTKPKEYNLYITQISCVCFSDAIRRCIIDGVWKWYEEPTVDHIVTFDRGVDFEYSQYRSYGHTGGAFVLAMNQKQHDSARNTLRDLGSDIDGHHTTEKGKNFFWIDEYWPVLSFLYKRQ